MANAGSGPATFSYRPRWRVIDWALALLFGLTLLAVSPIGQVIAIYALITFVGIPIYIVLAALPSVFLAVLLGRLVFETWSAWRGGSLFFGVLFSVLAAAMAYFFIFGAWVENIRLDRNVAALRAQDRDRLNAPPPKPGTLAVVTNSRNPREGDVVCDDLCLRLLLNGEVKRVLIRVAVPPPPPARDNRKGRARLQPAINERAPLAFDEKAEGRLYWLEARETCGEAKASDTARQLSLPPREQPQRGVMPKRQVRAGEALRLQLAAGRCLMSRPALLGEADAALVYGTLASGKGPYAAAYEASADTISAQRIAYLEKRGGTFAESYRATTARYYRFPWARAISYVHGSQFAMKTGYVRMFAQAGGGSRYEDNRALPRFVIERLGLKLHLEEEAGPAGGGEALDRILASSAALSELDNKILRDFIDHIQSSGFRRGYRLAPDDAARVLKIAADRRVALPWTFSGVVAAMTAGAPERLPALADSLFVRLAEAPASPPQSGSWREEVGSLAGAIARLPDDVLKQRRAEIEALARTSVKRDAARRLLNRMDVFGPDIVPQLVALMDSAMQEIQANQQANPKRRSSQASGEEALSAALANFCRLGEQAAFALPLLRERAVSGETPFLRRNQDLAIKTFARLGASEEETRELMKIDGADARALQRFDFAWRGASRKNPC